MNQGVPATRQEVRIGGPPTKTRWRGYHLAQPGSPPGPKGVYYPQNQTSNLKPYELPETKFAKELKDEIRELTEEEHEEMSGWLEDYLVTDLKEKMKHKATEVREKRSRKTLKGKSKVEFHKTLSDDSEEEILEMDHPLLSKVLQRIDRMNREDR